MTQSAWVPLVPETDNGTTLSNKLNALIPAIYSTHRGTTRPAYAVAGMLWIDSTTDTNEKLYLFDGQNDILLMAWDATTGVLTYGGGGGIAEYDAAKAYESDDLIIRSGGIYKAVQATGPGVYNPSHWQRIDAGAVTVPPAILRAPTTTAQNTITQSVDDQVPLRITPSPTSTAKQLEIGAVFTVDKDGAAYAAGRLTVENDIKVINDAASSVSGPNGNALKLFSDGTGASHAGLAIGVGDAPAGDRFFISAKADAALAHGSGTGGGQFNVTTSGDIYGKGTLSVDGNAAIGGSTNSSQRLRVITDATNDVGINLYAANMSKASLPAYGFYCNYGNVAAAGRAIGSYFIAGGTSAVSYVGYLSSMDSTQADKSGSKHFSAYRSGTEVFRVEGNGAVTAAGDITAFSDRRLKENLERIPDAIDKVCLLSGYTYDRIDQGPGRHAGVIAQEVEAVLPEAVTTQDNKQGTKSVNHAALVGLLVEATKELHLENDRLRADVKELRQIVNQLARGQ